MNMTKAIQHLFPNANPPIDFRVQDDSDGSGPRITNWTLDIPQPTLTELEAAWQLIKDKPAEKTPEQNEIDKLKADKEELNLKIIDLWETLLDAGVL